MAATASAPTTLAVTSAGSGDRVLLLIHGFPLTSEMWRHQVGELPSPSLRVIAPDLPGCGRTPGAITSVDDAADAIAAVAHEVGARRVILGGFSMGGYIAFAFARRHAAMLNGLILIDTKAGADSEEARKGRYALAERARNEGPGVVIDGMLPRLLADAALQHRPDLVQQVREIAADVTVDGIAGALHAMAERPSSEPNLPQIGVPTLVLVGEHDVITPREDAEAMASAIPDSRLVVIAGAAHLTPLEQPDAVNTAIRSWVTGVS
jgi:pimeloyl-ACP methyl ester carboxylesterase